MRSFRGQPITATLPPGTVHTRITVKAAKTLRVARWNTADLDQPTRMANDKWNRAIGMSEGTKWQNVAAGGNTFPAARFFFRAASSGLGDNMMKKLLLLTAAAALMATGAVAQTTVTTTTTGASRAGSVVVEP